MIPRAPRKNVMLAATISAGIVSKPVRICNLSEEGAMIDGPGLPEVGTALMLRRLDMSTFATVIWNHSGRCGLSLKRRIAVGDWIAGVKAAADGAGEGQSRVDQLLSAIRSGTALPVETEAPVPNPADARPLEQSIAAELARVKRMLDEVSEELTDDIDVLMRHQRAMQRFDIAAAIVEELARVMAADDRERAVASVHMHELRSRLSGRPTLT
jgi:hypothetical protein